MAQSRWRRPRPDRQVNHGGHGGYPSDRGREGNEAIRAALREAARTMGIERTARLRRAIGNQDIAALAIEMSGTSDKKSNAYKAARRNIERRLDQTRGLSGRRTATQQRIDAAIERRLQEAAPPRGEISFLDADVVQFNLIGWELEFNDYPAGRRPNYLGYLYRDDLAPALAALRRGRVSEAVNRLHSAMMAEYGNGAWSYSQRAGDTTSEGRQNAAIAAAQRIEFSRRQ
jgi:hypothetical protein